MIIHYIDEIMVIGCDEKQAEGARVVSVRYTDDNEWEINSTEIQGVRHTHITASA